MKKNLIKYANRKIYDSETTSYINLSQILELVLKGYTITVEEHETGKNVTNSIFSKIISEVVSKDSNLSMELLKKVIFAAYETNVDKAQQYNYTN